MWKHVKFVFREITITVLVEALLVSHGLIFRHFNAVKYDSCPESYVTYSNNP